MPPYCDKHFGFKENIRELCEFKRDMIQSGSGTIALLWTAIEKKVSRSVVIGFAFALMTVVTALFGLVYQSNEKVLHDMVSIKSNIQLIMETLK